MPGARRQGRLLRLRTARVLDDVSFTVEQGPLHRAARPERRRQDHALLADHAAARDAPGQHRRSAGATSAAPAPHALAPLGIVFQQPTLDLDLTVRQNLHYFARLRGLSRAEAERRIERELTRLDMAERARETVRALNGGHRRRVEIARALLHDPELLLLDEPTVGLDFPSRKAIVEHVHDLAAERGIGILWATHLIDEIRPTDDLVILHKGKVVASGRAERRRARAPARLRSTRRSRADRRRSRSAGMIVYGRAFLGIVWREVLRFLYQRERFLAALVRPLVWLVVFAAGFRAVLGISIIPPYETYITYEIYIVPGLIGMIQLFNGMQSSLSMVYDREMGSMRVLLTTPLPRWFLLVSKLVGRRRRVDPAGLRLPAHRRAVRHRVSDRSAICCILPAMVLSGLLLGAVGMFISSTVRQLENFAGVMNFVIFPTFFLSSALYPLWHMREVERAALPHLGGEPLHARGRAGPLRALRQARTRSRSPSSLGCLVAVPAARDLGLQAVARHGAAAARPAEA